MNEVLNTLTPVLTTNINPKVFYCDELKLIVKSKFSVLHADGVMVRGFA